MDLLISDLRMPKLSGMELQQEALKLNPHQLIILLTAYGSIETAVEAMRAGVYDFLTKPLNLDKFELVVERALKTKRLDEENKRLKQELKQNHTLKNLVGHSKKMQELFSRIKAISYAENQIEEKEPCLLS